MRNTPGNVIHFPESTLLVDIQRLTVPFEESEDYYHDGVIDVELEEGYIYHVTNGALVVHTPDEISSPVYGNVQVSFARLVGRSYLMVATVGYDLVFPPHAHRYGKSQLLDLWIWGNVRIGAEMTLAIETISFSVYELFLGKYRR
jgi:hypothetical protein